MLNLDQARKYCCEPPEGIEGFTEAMNDTERMWVIHHRDEVRHLPSGMVVWRSSQDLKDIGRYWKCPANELICMPATEHKALHNRERINPNKGKRITWSHKIAKALSGKPKSEFGAKFLEHFGWLKDCRKYDTERAWFKAHGHCRWEEG